MRFLLSFEGNEEKFHWNAHQLDEKRERVLIQCIISCAINKCNIGFYVCGNLFFSLYIPSVSSWHCFPSAKGIQ